MHRLLSAGCCTLLVFDMALEIVYMPDIEGSGEVVEYLVVLGETVEAGTPLIVVESDKASMEVPAPFAGVIDAWEIEIGESIETGVPIVKMQSSFQGGVEVTAEVETPIKPVSQEDGLSQTDEIVTIFMPDAGGDGDVIEFFIKPGDTFFEGDPILLVESDKAAMEVPAPFSGTLVEHIVKSGQTVSEGIALVSAISNSETARSVTSIERVAEPVTAPVQKVESKPIVNGQAKEPSKVVSSLVAPVNPASASVYSGPASRKLAREMGVRLEEVPGTGPKGRILKEDIKAFVKARLNKPVEAVLGQGIPAIPTQDFSRFGEVEAKDLSGMAKATAAHMSRCWLNIPHVTLFDESDITELESYRASIPFEKLGLMKKPTILPFLVLVIAKALRKYPLFNSALHSDGKQIIYKNYVNVGVAVDTPAGLVVPVIKDADKKSINEISEEIARLATKGRERKLTAEDMQGGSFTISSLGATGGTGFTPIINAPEVAILGVAKGTVKPVWDGTLFQPRTLLPLCLSFDHRVINGGDAGRFMATVNQSLADIRYLLL